jgi:hypothetical protein
MLSPLEPQFSKGDNDVGDGTRAIVFVSHGLAKGDISITHVT